MAVMLKHARAAMAATLLAGCAAVDRNETALSTGQNLTFVEANTEGFVAWSDTAPPVYRVGPGDRLKIKFLLTQEMDEDVIVSPDGHIGLRATGQVRATGRTLPELETLIRAVSRRTVADQQVVVSIEEAVSSRIYIGGAVRNPGSMQLTDMRINALHAVLLAGGFTDDARLGQIAVIRRSPEGKAMLRTLDIRAVIETGGVEDIALQPGDVIYVPRSSIAEVNLWVDQFINKVVPFQRSFGYTIGSYSTTTGGIMP
ncbi:protein involved in polysaccharide export with SLBB domain [Pseudochelatococcus lubricantis]|uniref:Protein involved in polysaccharide export with SLBB domain n=1 Tax=Pseudochelatococcus lubricantis TaxID=1538102 RepID=A0ABX0UVV7_9HYPH|nr:polysaccharide biosynthesis/export family protein [Pseudochelatococcus lubricantis]NIJ56399.1 protein involved in polysaccharide export with SLBB domain [Pseudochelatococcus lubricantis]